MKTSHPFSTTFTLAGNAANPIILRGIAYDYGAANDADDRYDYDLDAVLYCGTDIADLLTAQYGNPKEWDALHDAVMGSVVGGMV